MAKASRLYGHVISPDGAIASAISTPALMARRSALFADSHEFGELADLFNRTVTETRTVVAPRWSSKPA